MRRYPFPFSENFLKIFRKNLCLTSDCCKCKSLIRRPMLCWIHRKITESVEKAVWMKGKVCYEYKSVR